MAQFLCFLLASRCFSAVASRPDVQQSLELAQRGAPDADPNASASYHADVSSDYEQQINETDKCKACALAEQNLIAALQAAQEAHLAAQRKAEDWALASKDYEAESKAFDAALAAHAATNTAITSRALTYRSSNDEYEEFVQLAQQLHAQAQAAVQAETSKDEKKTVADAEQALHEPAAEEAVSADEIVVAKRAQEEAACPEYLAPTPSPSQVEAGTPWIRSSCDSRPGKWYLFGDIDDPTSNFKSSDFVSSPSRSGEVAGDSLQVGTFSAGTAGSPGYSFDIQQLASRVQGDQFDLMIQYGDADVYEKCLSGFHMSDGKFINNGRIRVYGVGEHGLWGAFTEKIDGYFATFCAVSGGCGGSGQDFWAFSTYGIFPSSASQVPCGFYYGGWKACPSGDNLKRMRYHVRFPEEA